MGASLLAMAVCQAAWIFEGAHIRFCGNGLWRLRSYSGSLGRAPSNQGLLPLTFGASPRLGMPSLRSCSVGPPPSAIHGRGRLTRHPCRVAHCAEPPLGLTRGRVPQQRPRRPTGRPGCWVRSSGRYLVDWQAAIASKLAPTVFASNTNYSNDTKPVGAAVRRSDLPAKRPVHPIEMLAGWQAAIASKLAPTEKQRQIGVHPRSSPLILSLIHI